MSDRAGTRRLMWLLAIAVAFAGALVAPERSSAQQNPCILIFPPPPGCQPTVGRISVNAGGPYSGQVGQSVVFRASVSSPLPPGTPFQFQWSFGDGSTGFGQTASNTYFQPGTFPVSVTVTGGGQTAFASTSASITQPIGPLQVSAGGPYSGTTGGVVQFVGSVTGAAPGAGITYQWGFGDGSFGGGQAPTHVYSAPGTYTVTLQVFTTANQSGFASTTAQIQNPAQPLTVSAGGPYSGTAGSTVTFTGSVTGARQPQFRWTFGDGAGGFGQSVPHVYVSAGTFAVTLTVTDLATGQSSQATTSALIAAPAPPPGPPPPPPPPPGPLGRAFASMAFHPPTGRVVLFGGLVCQGSICSDQNDTWTWDGTRWQEADPSNAPSSRYGAGMAYHAPSQRLVLFGGIDCASGSCTDYGDTWAWDGNTWTELSPSESPSERSDTSMAFDAERGVIVLFGGQDTGGDLLSDTWTWNGSTWTRQAPSQAPSPRFNASITFDGARGTAVLFGGSDNGPSNLADTWTWDGSGWMRQNPSVSPTPRAAAAMEFDAAQNLSVLFGGVTNGNQALGDTWVWNGENWQQRTPTNSPAPRYGSGTAYDPNAGGVVLFSGTNNNGDTWVWNGTTWSSR